MNSENSDQPLANLRTNKLTSLLKESFWTILGGLLGSSIVAYLSSRFFIKFYLIEIGYPSLTYSALLDNSTVSALTFGIFAVLIGFLFAFCVAPTVLRLLYTEKLKLYEEIHQDYKKPIIIFLSICLSLPLLVLIPEQYVPFFDTKHLIYLIFTSSLLFTFFLFKTWKKTTIEEKFKLLFNGLLFGGVSFFAFYPFLILINALNYSDIPNLLAYPITIVIWMAYSIFNGVRVVSQEIFQYFIDISIGLLVLLEVIILSSNTIKVPIAEFVGIKDAEAQIYEVSQSDYDELNQKITKFWQVGKTCSTGDTCTMISADYDESCIEDCENSVYLQGQVIFRDLTNAIICPPNYKFGKEMNDRCLLIEQSKIKPTSQTAASLKENSHVVVNSFVLQ
ncbi:hypothetical protein [uncultured Psychrobacter sp.]|jgi:hypothetical protein|uniref:hypothetical protein n=1 Tax=Psychrobacter TaxID=497 RepID=UPI002636F6FD|nr:hypothetical protein [uncultured Psychrobacter sp.]